jgi:hypothetical protein
VPGLCRQRKGENLARHLDRTHPDASGDTAALPSRLRVEPGGVTLRRRFGLGRRRVDLPAQAEVGSLVKGRISAGMTSYADDYNVPYDDVHAGTYLRLSNGAKSRSPAGPAPMSASTGPAGPPATPGTGLTSASTPRRSSACNTPSPRWAS